MYTNIVNFIVSEIPPDCVNHAPIVNGKVIPHGNMEGDLVEFTCDNGYRFEYRIDDTMLNATCNSTTGKFEPEPDKCVGMYNLLYSFKVYQIQ